MSIKHIQLSASQIIVSRYSLDTSSDTKGHRRKARPFTILGCETCYMFQYFNNNNNNNNNIYLLQLGCYPVAVVTLNVNKHEIDYY